MNITSSPHARALLLVAAALAPFCLSSNAPALKLRFAAAEGTSLTKTLENKAVLTLDDYTVTGAPGQAPDMEMTITINQKLVVTDEYVKNRTGAPQKLVRTFDEMTGDQAASMKVEMMGQSQSKDQNMRSKSELEGKKVVFVWDSEKSEYTKSFDPAQDKDDLLKGLEEDMDLRGLLPADDVKAGDEWDIPIEGLKHVFSPGGSLSMVPENADEEGLNMGLENSSMSEMIGDKLEGTAKAKLTTIEEIEGVQCARIHVDLKVKSSADMTEMARKMLADTKLPPGVDELELDHLDVDFGFEGEGDLVWDIAGGHFRTFELSGQMTIKTDQGVKIAVQGRSMSINETRSMSGTSTYVAKAL